ncbi:MAG: hypothetical protein ACJ74Z_13935 [Bryobacteraceae bacterium]
MNLHRRDALWQVQKYSSRVAPILENVAEQDDSSPLPPMSTQEPLLVDYHGTGLIVRPHPMSCRREELRFL